MKKTEKFDDIQGYAESLSKNCMTDERAPTTPELLQSIMTSLDQDGYAIVENLVPSDELSTIRTELLEMLDATGQDSFSGFKTQRRFSLLQKTLCCNPLIEHPIVLDVLDQLFNVNYLLSQTVAINIMPGEKQQLIHYDDAFYQVARPRKALSVATMWAFDDFTKVNGGTMVIPGSHKWPDRAPTQEDMANAINVEMSAGSMFIWLGTLWHSGGANNSDANRLGMTAQYCEPWCRPVENTFLTIPKETVQQCSQNMRSMLGYSLHGPFMGYIDNARHPRHYLEV